MPYLDAPWSIDQGTGETFEAHQWVPELDRVGWIQRDSGLTFRSFWEFDATASRTDLEVAARTSAPVRDDYLTLLGRDAGSIQRDGLFYMNGIERLKASPNDETADQVVERMHHFGFTSAGWAPEIGGPPPQMSPRPWKRVMEWLFGLVAKAAAALTRAADFLSALVADGQGISAVAVGVMPPSIGVELSADLFRDAPAWDQVHVFLTNMQAEISATVLA